MTIKLNNPEIEHYFIDKFQSDIKAFSEFILKSIEKDKNRFQLSNREIEKIVENSQRIEGYESLSEEYEEEVEVYMKRHNLEVSA